MEQRRSSQATGEHGEAEASREWRFLALVSAVLFGIQLLVTIVVGIYFYTQLRQQRRAQPSNRRESGRVSRFWRLAAHEIRGLHKAL